MQNSVLRSVYKVRPTIQHYDWGMIGDDSLVWRLSPRLTDPALPHAELWFGTHPKSPAFVETAEGELVPLPEIVSKHSELSGSVDRPNNSELPYLLKVLSVAKPLSIQLHPDSLTAPRLHAQNPANYPDNSHKPEMSVALTELELLFGFKGMTETLASINRFGAFREFLQCNLPDSGWSKQSLFSALMNLGQDAAGLMLSSVADEMKASGFELFDADKWFLRSLEFFSVTDVGLFAFFFLNLVRVNPGEAIFIGPNIPHAYLSGQMIECMACSDNVVRLGLTEKFRDVSTMLEIIDYSESLPVVLSTSESQAGEQKYTVPVSDFLLTEIVGDGKDTKSIKAGRSIIFSESAEGILEVEGESSPYNPGDAFFFSGQASCFSLRQHRGRVFRVSVSAVE